MMSNLHPRHSIKQVVDDSVVGRVLSSCASTRFRFRFVTRGERANALVILAMKSLQRCHPNASILLVDANDSPAFHRTLLDVGGYVEVIHITPEEDEIAQVVGRGSRQHLFYWRHSPQVLKALPPSDQFSVYADGDIIFLRPMDLASLIQPLTAGRIAAAIDESSIEYYGRIEHLMPNLVHKLPAAISGGPLIQSGLIFTNPANDSEFYDRFWKLAIVATQSGQLTELPFDDMCLITALLTQGGPLWERLLPLGHEWNYISDAEKDPGIFGCAAHCGGHKAKTFMLNQRSRLFPPDMSEDEGWGTVRVSEGMAHSMVRGPWTCYDQSKTYQHVAVPIPFALSWPIPSDMETFGISALFPDESVVTFLIYVDGRLVDRVRAKDRRIDTIVRVVYAETITIIGVSNSSCCQALLRRF